MIRLLPLLVLLAAASASAQVNVNDGVISETPYRLLDDNAGGPAPGFGAGHEINALYAHVRYGAENELYLGVAGNVQQNNRILVFLDTKAGGYTTGDFGRTGAPAGLAVFNSGTTFDAGFAADYALVIGTFGGNYFVDLFTLAGTAAGGGGSNRFIGDVADADVGASPANGSTTRGFEVRLTFSATGAGADLALDRSHVRMFAAYTSEGDGTLSNQFVSPAGSGDGNYGNGAINFGAATPNPVSFVFQRSANVAGYRLLSAPVDGVRVADLGSLNLVQGVTGQYPTAQDNLFLGYTGTAYTPAASTADAVEPGRGFFWQFYDQDITPQPGSFGGGTSRSYELSTFAIEAGGATTPMATVTRAFAENAVDRFYMVGNPFAYPMTVDGITATAATGTLSNQFAAFNPATGSYVLRFKANPANGSAPDSIATWQGLFAEMAPVSPSTSTGAPTFSFDYAKRLETARPRFHGRQGTSATSFIQLHLSGATGTGLPVNDEAAYVRLLPDAIAGWDPNDASKLTPPSGPYALVAPVGERNGAPYRTAVNSLPDDGTARTVPVSFLATDAGTYTLTWDAALAVGWSATLRDLATGVVTDLGTAEAYTFTSDAAAWTERFELVLSPRGATATDGGTPADAFRLAAARPNPVRGAATVMVELGAPQHVRAALTDALGRRVLDVFDAAAPAGALDLRLDAAGLAPGVYVLRVTGATATATQTVTVVR
ncbi:MAG TPA: T9SS type A sorting domain-containing protein [Rubricoccaceae bacterium]|jgi:hypothetical protein